MENVVVIPAYNEGERIAAVIEKTRQFVPQIIVVDDGSRDNTPGKAQLPGVTVLRHRVNLGKGAALKTGCDYALEQDAKNIVVMDADGQHDPKEIPAFLKALKEVDIVFGRRSLPENMPTIFRFGNTFISRALKFLYGFKVHDSQCGYRAFTAEAYKKIRWDTLDYFVETEMIVKAGNAKLRHKQVPIETIYADNYKGTTVLDGMMIVGKILGGRMVK